MVMATNLDKILDKCDILLYFYMYLYMKLI